MLSKIKANLYLPQDEEILQRLEGIIRDLLSKEQNSSTRQLIQTVCIHSEHLHIFFFRLPIMEVFFFSFYILIFVISSLLKFIWLEGLHLCTT